MITAEYVYEKLKENIGEELSDAVLREKSEIAEEILSLKREKNAVILAHYYVDPLLFYSIPDIRGDSLELSRKAAETESDIILVCGVSFMAETAKLLNPEKKVLIPAKDAGCSLAESIRPEDVRELRRKFPGATVAAYINTYAELKAEADICVTSGNAERIIGLAGDEKIIFVPDELMKINIETSLGKTGGEIIGWKGRCEVHDKFSLGDVEKVRRDYPGAVILTHPECRPEVVSASDFSGSTSAMINFIRNSESRDFCILSESAMEKNIMPDNPGKRFIPAPGHRCPHMKKITLENTLEALREEKYEIEIPDSVTGPAARSVERMLDLSGNRK